MPMAWEKLSQDAQEQNVKSREKWIGVYIGILAVILAICGVGGGNATKDSTLKNIEASNNWGFFQAKNIRRNEIRLQMDELSLMLESTPGMPDEAKKHMQAKLDDYRAQDKKLTTDPETQQGLDELFAKGKALEKERDIALTRDPYFDDGQALLQIAIVLASVAIITGGLPVLAGSIFVGALGVLATLGGFTLAFPLPFAG
jgi:hypothetical protein